MDKPKTDTGKPTLDLERGGVEFRYIDDAGKPAGVFVGMDEEMTVLQKNTTPLGKLMQIRMDQLGALEREMATLAGAVAKALASAVQATSEANGKLRDGADKLTAAFDKVVRVTGRHDLTDTVRQLSALADAMERLSALEQSGRLARVVQALTNQQTDNGALLAKIKEQLGA